jgi:PAT family beta-lactamase induction signal transducer AmpG
VVVMTLAWCMYKNLGVGNTEIALYTSWLYLPWVIKPLWSPLVDLLGTKRRWIVALQFAVGAALACVALALPGPKFLQMTLAVFWLMAFASATHDIAADGFYMLALPQRTQAAFVGVRSTFYRLSMIGGQGGLVYLAGWLAERSGSPVQAWVWVFWPAGGAVRSGRGAVAPVGAAAPGG